MRASLDDAAVYQNRNQIGPPDSGQTVRDDQGRPIAHEAVERPLYRDLRLRIQRGCGFVENKYRRVFEDRARDGEPLPLATG